MATLAERWQDKGKIQGKIKGQRELLIHLLTLKFGIVSDKFIIKIESATSEQLIHWSGRILSEECIDDIFQ